MELQFTGKITEIRNVRTGEGDKGEWANVEFEVTESDPQNENYPQVALFDYFKNGEYVDMAKKFSEQNNIGDEVTVHFNLKKSIYQKRDGSGEASFYKTSAWKVEKLNSEGVNTYNTDKHDDLDF